MQDQLDRSKAETEGMLKMKAEVEEILEGLGNLGIGEKHGNEDNGIIDGEGKAEVVEEGRDIWEELEKEFSWVTRNTWRLESSGIWVVLWSGSLLKLEIAVLRNGLS